MGRGRTASTGKHSIKMFPRRCHGGGNVPTSTWCRNVSPSASAETGKHFRPQRRGNIPGITPRGMFPRRCDAALHHSDGETFAGMFPRRSNPASSAPRRSDGETYFRNVPPSPPSVNASPVRAMSQRRGNIFSECFPVAAAVCKLEGGDTNMQCFLANQCTVTPSRSVSKEPREGAVKSGCGRLFFFFRYQERGKAGKGRRTCFMDCFIPRVAFAGLPVCLICSVLFNVRFTFDCFFGFYFLPLPLSSYSVPLFFMYYLFLCLLPFLRAQCLGILSF